MASDEQNSENPTSARYQRAQIVVECGMGCGWATKIPWSNRVDGAPGREGDDLPEPGQTLEGPIVCPDCEDEGIAHSGRYPVTDVSDIRTVNSAGQEVTDD